MLRSFCYDWEKVVYCTDDRIWLTYSSKLVIGNFSCLQFSHYPYRILSSRNDLSGDQTRLWSPWSPQSVWSLRLVWSVCVVALVRPVSLGLVSLEDLVTLVSLLTICILNNFEFHLAQLWTDFSVLFILLLFSHWICNLRCSDLVTWDEDDFYSRGEEDAYKSHDEVNYHWKFPTNVSIFVAQPPLFWVLVTFHC